MPPVRRNRRRYDSPVNHDRWMVSYADFVTLLFAFFTTMYAISTVDAKKLQDMVESMQSAFDANKPMPVKATDALPKAAVTPTPEETDLLALKARLSQRLKMQIDGGQVGLEVDPRGLVVSIREAGTFSPGSAELSDSAREVLAEVAQALAGIDNPVRVEGHTDDVPINTARYRSNWELSTARATNVVSFLMQEHGMSPSRFSAAGYGEFHPRSANTSSAARAQNRRVDIVILNDETRRREEPEQKTTAAPAPAPAPASAPAASAPAPTQAPASAEAPAPGVN
jgi:chemotaxis protein MotB